MTDVSHSISVIAQQSRVPLRPLQSDEADRDAPDGFASLFTQPEDAPLLALLDASRFAGLPEILEGSGLAHHCLYDGKLASDLSDVAPYLVRLPRDAPLLRQLLCDAGGPFDKWSSGAALFLESKADMETLRAHLRRFILLPQESGGRVFFRFWEHDILEAVTGANPPIGALQTHLFGAGEPPLITRFVALDPQAEEAILIDPPETIPPRNMKRAVILDAPVQHVLRRVMTARFAAQLTQSCAALFPALLDRMSTADQRAFIGAAMTEGRALGLTQKAPATVWAELTCLLGAGLSRDPQYAGLLAQLGGLRPDAQMPVANRLYQWMVAYNSAVMGPQNVHFKQALARIEATLHAPKSFGPEELLRHVWPEKCNFIGPDAVTAFIQSVAGDKSHLPPLSLSERRTYLLLCFFLGRECANDPCFEWVAKSLRTGPDPGASLARRAMVWLSEVNERINRT